MSMCADCKAEANEMNGTSFDADPPQLKRGETCSLCGYERDMVSVLEG